MSAYLPYMLIWMIAAHSIIAFASGNPWLALDKTILILVSAFIGFHICDKL